MLNGGTIPQTIREIPHMKFRLRKEKYKAGIHTQTVATVRIKNANPIGEKMLGGSMGP
jgi:hypothetical protein